MDTFSCIFFRRAAALVFWQFCQSLSKKGNIYRAQKVAGSAPRRRVRPLPSFPLLASSLPLLVPSPAPSFRTVAPSSVHTLSQVLYLLCPRPPMSWLPARGKRGGGGKRRQRDALCAAAQKRRFQSSLLYCYFFRSKERRIWTLFRAARPEPGRRGARAPWGFKPAVRLEPSRRTFASYDDSECAW